MKKYIIRKIFSFIICILAVTLFSFSLLHLIPGDPVRYILGEFATEEQYQKLKHQLGLDKPIHIQFIDWLANIILRGDFGKSLVKNVPVRELISERIVYTLQLTGTAWLIAFALGIPLGIAAAIYKQTAVDYTVMGLAAFLMSMPYFWLGLVLMLIFGVMLKVLPISGIGDWRNVILPSLTLGLPQVAVIARLMRANMLDVLDKDYVMTAKAKGLSNTLVVFKHALRNALIPIVTYMFLQIPWLFGGAVVTETVFAWPGMGRLLIISILQRDYPTVQALVFLIGTLTVIANFAADLVYAFIDPRVRVTGEGA
ncbi:MAG: ABC transporter permease [Desulfurococcales archaeon]|nr:ABC transporter permease [Desulfurococcales archaeon]